MQICVRDTHECCTRAMQTSENAVKRKSNFGERPFRNCLEKS
jgi:hypothetical protein